ncbi:YciI family protein [Fodinicola acaciae]|uniref:YciI family protein n=1 Tax=Fodinicola acaciae TaxID=2681555 RepID=UPI0013D08622|nr:YciI family protein [Fodinicola acaciae]
MKYILLAYANREAWDAAETELRETGKMPDSMQKACDFYEEIGKELAASGEFVTAEGLGHPAQARTVRNQAGAAVASDGPYAEAKEVLVSFSILDCASYDRAMEIAARVTENVGDTVEVRPIGA